MEPLSTNLEEKLEEIQVEEAEKIKKLNTTNFLQIFVEFSKKFLIVFGIRAIYSIIQLIRFKRKSFVKLTMNIFLGKIFNMSNLRTSLCVSFLPFSYKLLKLILNKMINFSDTDNSMSDILTFIIGFISAFISINLEERTPLVHYVILSIMVRVLHTSLQFLFKKLNIFQNTGKKWDFMVFLMAAVFMWSIYFLNPDYKPITDLFDKYANYANEEELAEAVRFRQMTKIV